MLNSKEMHRLWSLWSNFKWFCLHLVGIDTNAGSSTEPEHLYLMKLVCLDVRKHHMCPFNLFMSVKLEVQSVFEEKTTQGEGLMAGRMETRRCTKQLFFFSFKLQACLSVQSEKEKAWVKPSDSQLEVDEVSERNNKVMRWMTDRKKHCRACGVWWLIDNLNEFFQFTFFFFFFSSL